MRRRREGDKPELHMMGRRMALPRSPALRVGLGVALVAGGALGFLPVLGFWMIPLGLGVLAWDVPAIERAWRSGRAWWLKRRRRREARRDDP